MTRGRFFVLDGIDGCGKSTQAARLVETLEEAGRRPLHVREPGSTPLGERLRALLLDPELEAGVGAEALLFTAARRELLERVIAPALDEGRDVVCERFHPATFAYQACAGELGEDEVLALLHGWAGEPAPDRVVLLELAPAEAARRRGPATDRIEARGLAFQERVAAGFRRYAERVPGTLVVPAAGDPDEVARRIAEELLT